MLETNGLNFETLAPKGCLHVAIHPELVVFAESEACTYWRVMAHLLTEIFEVLMEELKSFSQDRIEGLIGALVRTLILGYSKCRYVH